LHEDAPPGDVPFPYAQTKAEQERIARRLQDQGAPVVTTYPGQVLGPDDPYEGEGTRILRSIVRGEFMLCPRGDIPTVDVRDVAQLHARVFEAGKGPRRHLIARPTKALELARTTLKLAGGSLPVIPVPDMMARIAGRCMGWLQPRINRRLSLSDEGSWVATRRLEIDMTSTERLGIVCRPIQETIADQLAWQRAAELL
jgi:dihydroflavonol-4-reductase